MTDPTPPTPNAPSNRQSAAAPNDRQSADAPNDRQSADAPSSRRGGDVPSRDSQAARDIPAPPAYPAAPTLAAPTPTYRERDVPDPPPGRRATARDALLVVAIAVVLLVVFQGAAVRGGAEELSPGLGRDVVEAVGHPTGWVADRLPLSGHADSALAWLETDGAPAAAAAAAGDRTLLVTGDSLAMPLDTELARRYAGTATAVERDPHVGTGISKSDLVDWRELSAKQARRHEPDVAVVFIGANEGFPLPAADGPGDGDDGSGADAADGGSGDGRRSGGAPAEADCCGADWQAAFAVRVRAIMDAYLRDGEGRVYWLTVPKPRDPARQEISDAVNAAVRAAAEEAGDGVVVIDLDETFAPDGGYTDAIEVDGRERIVREQDGIHLNAAGAAVAADVVQDVVGDALRP